MWWQRYAGRPLCCEWAFLVLLALLLCLPRASVADKDKPGSAMENAAAMQVLVVMKGDDAIQHAFLSALQTRLETEAGERIALRSTHLPVQREALSTVGLDLILTVGSEAAQEVTQAAATFKAPVLLTLLPRSTHEILRRQWSSQRAASAMSAVLIDQPFERQFDFILTALPTLKQIVVLLGPTSRQWREPLIQAGRDVGVQVLTTEVARVEDISPALDELADPRAALLAVPDALVYSPGTAAHILLAAYRQRMPVIGYSQSYVKAGALAAVHSTPEQLGLHVAETLLSMADRRTRLPTVQFPRHFSVSTNRAVARSLGVPLEEDEHILQRMMSDSR